jgi:hypothetical protein
MGASSVTPLDHKPPEFLIDRSARVTMTQQVAGKERAESVQSTTPVPAAKWLNDTLEEVEQLSSLDQDWDGYGAERVSASAAMGAVNFLLKIAYPKLAAPEVVPVSDGGLQVEWHRNGIDFEVMFEPEEEPRALVEDRTSKAEPESVAGDEAINALHRLVDRLSER